MQLLRFYVTYQFKQIDINSNLMPTIDLINLENKITNYLVPEQSLSQMELIIHLGLYASNCT